MTAVGAPRAVSPALLDWAADDFHRTTSRSSSHHCHPIPHSLSPASPTPFLLPFPSADSLFADSCTSSTAYYDEESSSPLPSLCLSTPVDSGDDLLQLVLATPPSPLSSALSACAQSIASPSTATVAAGASIPPVAAARPRFVSRKVACQVCHFAKVRCEGGRPCERCIRHSHTAHCSDRPSRRAEKRKRALSQSAEPPPPATATADWEEGGTHSSTSLSLASQPRTVQHFASAALRLSRQLSLPLSACHLPVDTVRFSSRFVTGHLRWLSDITVTDLRGLLGKMHLREKLIQGVWMNQLLTPSDMMTLSHAVPMSSTWWEHYVDPRYHRHLKPLNGRPPMFDTGGGGGRGRGVARGLQQRGWTT